MSQVRRILSSSLLPLSVAVSSLACVSLARAQNSVAGGIGGTIYDAQKAAVPNATVTAVNNGTQATVSVKSNPEGFYRFGQLEPGQYTVMVTMDGFKMYKEESVTVQVGLLTDFSPLLSTGSATETVDVTDEAPLMHTQSSEISTVIDQNLVDNLPIDGRRYSNFALLTPGVVSNSDGFGLLSFRGISYLLNNVTVDGADNNQAYFSEAVGRTRAQYAVSLGAVQEFQVNTSNYSAEYGRSAGGVINTVTKSGSNDFHGELYFYDRDNDWGATNPYTLISTQVPNTSTFVTTDVKPKDWRKQWGFGVGGPIIHDKLFWFYAYDQSRRNFPGIGRASDPQDTFAPANATLPAGETCAASGTLTVAATLPNAGTFTSTSFPVGSQYAGDLAACTTAANFNLGGGAMAFQQGSAYYGQGLNIEQSFLGVAPRTQDQVLNFPKLDYQVNDRNHLTLQYNRLRLSSPAGVQTSTSVFYGTHSFGNDFVKVDSGIARLNTTLTSRIANQVLFQYSRDFEFESSQNPAGNEIPLTLGANNPFGRPPEDDIGYTYDTTGFTIGKSEILERRALPNERRLQAMDEVTWTHGRHVTKMGVDFNRVFDYINNLYDENGDYSHDLSTDFVGDYLHYTNGLGGAKYAQKYYGFSQGFGQAAGEIATTEYAGFLTDDWRITPNLTLTLGIRYEYQYVPVSPFINNGNPALNNAPAVPQTANRPDDRNNVGPRLGFAYNFGGNGKTVLRGGYGMYYGLIPNANILQTYIESGAPNAQISVSGIYGACGPTFPNLLPSISSLYACEGSGFKPSTIAYLDKHLQNPEVHEADLSLEQDLGWNTSLQVTYMGSFGRELDSSTDTNTADTANATVTYTVAPAATSAPSGYIVHPHGGFGSPLPVGFQYTTKLFTNGVRPNNNYGVILDIASNVNSSYNALAAQITHRLNHGFSVLSSYTWSHALDFNPYIGTGVPTFNVFDPTNLRKEYGNSSLDVRNRFVFAAVYAPDFHLTGYKKYLGDGWRFAPIVQAQDGLPFTPSVSGSPTGLENAAGATLTPAFKGVNGSGSSANRIDILGRNQFHNPDQYKVDARLSKNFNFDTPYRLLAHTRLELLAEVFNLTNHQNITSTSHGLYAISAPQNSINANVLTFTPTFGTNLNSNNNQTWEDREIEIAARFHF